MENQKKVNNMPQAKKKQPKKSTKKSDEVSNKLEEAITFLLDELDDVKSKLEKVMNRMGL